ncbi:MAG: CopD family protein [Pyrinomonadaceae bacterium]|nr:CopD family protein [Pyrinomonadaceae bacterium]
MVASSPSANETLSSVPKAIELTFSVAVQPSMSSITIIASDGKRYEFNDLTARDGDKVIAAALPELTAGKYTVEWKALSADDHMIRGSFPFEVKSGESPEAAPPAATAQEPAPSAEHDHSQMDHSMHETPAGINWPQSLIRWLAYIAMLTLAGVFAFCVIVLRPAIGESAAEGRILSIAFAAVLLLIVANLAALVLQSSMLFDTGFFASFDPAQLQRVVTETTFGPPWAMQTAWSVVVLVAVIVLRGGKRINFLWWFGLVASAFILLAPSLTGHARAAFADYQFSIVSGWLHLVAAAVWVGGLVQIGFALPAVLASAGRERLLEISAVIARFNKAAMAATAVIVLTGLYNSWIHVEGPAALIESQYGWVLMAKAGLSLVMVVLGGVNAFVVHPKIKQQANAEGDPGSDASLPLLRNVKIEVAIAAAVLLLAAILAFLPPAREHSQQAEFRPPKECCSVARL